MTGEVREPRWFFGIMREGGTYNIVAAGPSEARVRREIAHLSSPTMVVTREDLRPLGVSDAEVRRWLPEQAPREAPAVTTSR